MTDTPTEHARAAGLLSLTADIVVAFLANNKLDLVAVPEVISATRAALVHLTAPQVEAVQAPVREKPNRAAIRKSVKEGGDRVLPRWEDVQDAEAASPREGLFAGQLSQGIWAARRLSDRGARLFSGQIRAAEGE